MIKAMKRIFKPKQKKEQVSILDFPVDFVSNIYRELSNYERWGIDSITEKREGQQVKSKTKSKWFDCIYLESLSSCFGDFIHGNIYIKINKTEYLKIWFESC